MCVDPLAAKYPYNGVYNFSENRVIDGREIEGLEVQLIVEKPDVTKLSPGHTFVTVGSGKNMTAYTYGRWAGTERSSGGNLANPLGNGPGVLIKLTGNDAMKEVKKYVSDGAKVYDVANTSEKIVRSNFEKQFNSTSKTPEKGSYEGDKRAHVIDQYDLTTNNCTTKSLNAVSEGHDGDITFKTTTIAGGFPVIQTDSTDKTYSPGTLATQLQQATKDPDSDVKDVTNNYIKKQ
jgi:hypothetical protein